MMTYSAEIERVEHCTIRLWYLEVVYIVDNQEKTLLMHFSLRDATPVFTIRSQNRKTFD